MNLVLKQVILTYVVHGFISPFKKMDKQHIK